jgi:hypothetical protein
MLWDYLRDSAGAMASRNGHFLYGGRLYSRLAGCRIDRGGVSGSAGTQGCLVRPLGSNMNPLASTRLDRPALTEWRPAAMLAGIVWALCAAHIADAQSGPSGPNTITCASDNGQRQYCKADTRHGVRLIRETSGFDCRQTSWGYDGGGVWVDGGCHAEFDLSGGAGNARDGAGRQMITIAAGTSISVRNNETIDVLKSDGREFSGAVYQDVLDENGDVAIPRGSYAELIVKNNSDEYLELDLELVEVNGLRYSVTTVAGGGEDGEPHDGLRANARTGNVVDAAKLTRAIKQVLTRGKAKVLAASFLTFHLKQPLEMGVGR